MSIPFDDATTFLTTNSAIVRQVYHDSFEDMYSDFTRINKLFKPSKRNMTNSDGWNIQLRDYNMHGARTDTDLNADFPTPRSYGVSAYKITLSETPASNDIRRIALSLQTTWMDLKRAYTNKVSPEDFATQIVTQANRDIDDSMALHRYLDTTSRLGQVNGTPKRNNAEFYADAGAITTTGGALILVDNGSLANFSRGMVLDRYTGNTLDGQVFVTHINPVDGSVGLWGIDASGAPSSTVNISDIANDDSFYLSGEKDKGLKSMGYWYSTPTAGESFFGKDRTNPDNRWLVPTRSGPATERQFVKTDLDDLSIAMGYVLGDDPEGAYLVLSTPELDQRLRNEIGNDVLIQFPSTDQKGKLIANYGFDSAMYRHPRMGRMVFEVDPRMVPNRIRGLRMADWEMFTPPGGDRFNWMPGTMGNWYRMPSSTPGNGDTTTFRMDGFTGLADGCLQPRRQWEIRSVRAGA